MPKSRSLWVTILIGVLAILFTVAVLVAWNIIFTRYYVLATETQTIPDLGVGYWLILSFGSLFLVLVVVTLLLFLIANVRQALYMTQQKTFIDSVTHELKSPLASILLSLETMEVRKLTPEMQGRFLSMMKKDVNRLREFVDHVLVAGRLDHEDRELHWESVDLAQVVDDCANRVRQRHALSSDRITVELRGEPRPVTTDRVAFETICLNLLDNAVKYSPKPPTVVASLEVTDQQILLHVRDQGIGLPKKELKRVFDRFYRVQRQGGPVARGTGLGLYVVASLVRRLHGRIRARSDGEGQGSLFIVELPTRSASTANSDPPPKSDA